MMHLLTASWRGSTLLAFVPTRIYQIRHEMGCTRIPLILLHRQQQTQHQPLCASAEHAVCCARIMQATTKYTLTKPKSMFMRAQSSAEVC